MYGLPVSNVSIRIDCPVLRVLVGTLKLTRSVDCLAISMDSQIRVIGGALVVGLVVVGVEVVAGRECA